MEVVELAIPDVDQIFEDFKKAPDIYAEAMRAIESGNAEVVDAVLFCGRFNQRGQLLRECAPGESKPYRLIHVHGHEGYVKAQNHLRECWAALPKKLREAAAKAERSRKDRAVRQFFRENKNLPKRKLDAALKKFKEDWGGSGFCGGGAGFGAPYQSGSDLGSGQMLDPNQFTEFTPWFSGPFYKNIPYAYFPGMASSREAVNHHPIAKRTVNIMVQYAFGREFPMECKDKTVNKKWKAYVHQTKLRHKLRLHWGREYFTDGELTVNKADLCSIDASTIMDVVCEGWDEFIDRPIYYQQMYQCLHGDTRIALLDGTNPTVRELAERGGEYWVYSYDHETGRIVPGKAIKTWKQPGEKRCVKVTLDSGEAVTCSFDHPFLMRDGRYIWAEELKSGDSLMPLYRKTMYEKLWQPKTGWEYTHHMVAGKPAKGHAVHHKNHKLTDNRPENVETLTHSEHMAGHIRQTRSVMAESSWCHTAPGRGSEWRKNQGIARKKYLAEHPEARAEMSARVKAQWAIPGMREKRGKAISASWDRKNSEQIARQSAIVVNHKVLSVEPAGMQDVYDLTVDKHHNFALAVGVFTHNTATQTYAGIEVPGVPKAKDTKPGKWIVRQIPADQVIRMRGNCTSQEKRGRPFIFDILGWLKKLKDTYTGKVLAEQLQACFVYDVTVDGGPGDVAAEASKYKYIPVAPSIRFHNKAITFEAVAPTAGKQGGGTDTAQEILALLATAMGFPKDFFNVMAQGSGSRATAIVGSEPFTKVIEEFQQDFKDFLDDIIEDFCERVAHVDYNEEDWKCSFPSVSKDSAKDVIANIGTAKELGVYSDRAAATKIAAELGDEDYDFDRMKQEQIADLKKYPPTDTMPGWTPPAGRFGVAPLPGKDGEPEPTDDNPIHGGKSAIKAQHKTL